MPHEQRHKITLYGWGPGDSTKSLIFCKCNLFAIVSKKKQMVLDEREKLLGR